MKFYILAALIVLTACVSPQRSENRVPAGVDKEAEAKAEAELIKSLPKAKISREKGVLTLKLKNGKKKAFKDNLTEGTESYVRHNFVEYIAKNQIAVIQQHFYEGGQFLVVSLQDGSEIVTPTKPTWSPEKNNFISVNDDESDYTENRTVIGECKAMKCKKVFSEEAHAGNEKWIDERTVEYEFRKFDPGTGKSEASLHSCKLDKKVTCSAKK